MSSTTPSTTVHRTSLPAHFRRQGNSIDLPGANIQAPLFGWADFDAEHRRYNTAKGERHSPNRSSNYCSLTSSLELGNCSKSVNSIEVEPSYNIETDHESIQIPHAPAQERVWAHDLFPGWVGRNQEMLTQVKQLDVLCGVAIAEEDSREGYESSQETEKDSVFSCIVAKFRLEEEEEEEEEEEDLVRKRPQTPIEELNRTCTDHFKDSLRKRWTGFKKCCRRVLERIS